MPIIVLTLFTEKQMLLFTIKHLQSHAFLQTYNAILPTSLISLRFSTRGYAPWRPAAVISTNVSENKTPTRLLWYYHSFWCTTTCTQNRHQTTALFCRTACSCAKWLIFRAHQQHSFKKKRQLFSNEQQESRAYLLLPVLPMPNFITKANTLTFPKTVSEY